MSKIEEALPIKMRIALLKFVIIRFFLYSEMFLARVKLCLIVRVFRCDGGRFLYYFLSALQRLN